MMIIFKKNPDIEIIWTNQDTSCLGSVTRSGKLICYDDRGNLFYVEPYIPQSYTFKTNILTEYTVTNIENKRIYLKINNHDFEISPFDNMSTEIDFSIGDKVLVIYNLEIGRYYIIPIVEEDIIQDPDEEINEIYEHFRI